ncbi:hypothetical protein DIPPA_24962 [Diplonema papillatum]|nr:hypothetical protein DIPPA_24962 [Diplonema papillatum]
MMLPSSLQHRDSDGSFPIVSPPYDTTPPGSQGFMRRGYKPPPLQAVANSGACPGSPGTNWTGSPGSAPSPKKGKNSVRVLPPGNIQRKAVDTGDLDDLESESERLRQRTHELHSEMTDQTNYVKRVLRKNQPGQGGLQGEPVDWEIGSLDGGTVTGTTASPHLSPHRDPVSYAFRDDPSGTTIQMAPLSESPYSLNPLEATSSPPVAPRDAKSETITSRAADRARDSSPLTRPSRSPALSPLPKRSPSPTLLSPKIASDNMHFMPDDELESESERLRHELHSEMTDQTNYVKRVLRKNQPGQGGLQGEPVDWEIGSLDGGTVTGTTASPHLSPHRDPVSYAFRDDPSGTTIQMAPLSESPYSLNPLEATSSPPVAPRDAKSETITSRAADRARDSSPLTRPSRSPALSPLPKRSPSPTLLSPKIASDNMHFMRTRCHKSSVTTIQMAPLSESPYSLNPLEATSSPLTRPSRSPALSPLPKRSPSPTSLSPKIASDNMHSMRL